MSEKIVDNKVIEKILSDAPYLRLGLCNNGRPYIVPMSFGYRDGAIYLHSSITGTKMDFLRSNKHVCFEVDLYYETLRGDHPCSYNMKYQSVVGFGTAAILDNEQQIKDGIACIIDRYHGEEYCVDDLNLTQVAVIRIDIEELHGKQNGMDSE
ncbi:pyridoxamine 5'-phosphate oxidase family protein [Methanogenium sp. S4BF]|uniref:pyridoxamine 5'-phosphate oxidase family protein n=1 Tax=Methanogenium sp. S4BF TaxID=1789226 RepID=UPI0024169F6D|nr:pyridoxamine 5'-phosphate oxidase family protein [Methanogenium sp. S4BF]WFN35216.1 pyridoxamine 5'-phosphate oxidase family protein [Methanogenium sp. S4BF]